MTNRDSHIVKDFFSHPLLACSFFVLVYWFLESVVHRFFFQNDSTLSHLLPSDSHEIWMRVVVIFVLIAFSFYNQKIIRRLKLSERSLELQKKEVQDILEKNPAAIVLIECDTRKIAYVNDNATRLIGLPADRLMGKKCHDFICIHENGKCPILDMGKHVDISERELYSINNVRIPILKSASPIQYQGRAHLLEAFFDITQQKRVRLELKQAHAELDQIFQTATVGMRLIDNNFNILKINQTFSKLSGCNPEQSLGRKCYEIFAGNMCHTEACSLQRVLAGKALNNNEVNKTRTDGSSLTCSLTVTPFTQPDGSICIIESFNDITELKRIQNQLQAERDRLHRILFHQFEPMGIITNQHVVEFHNELLKKHNTDNNLSLCYEVFMGESTPCKDCYMQKAFITETVQRFEYDTADGKSFQNTYTPFIDNNGYWKAVVTCRDITETRASAAAAINSERLAALGELAAGVAHEINNPINGIINYAQILVNRTDENPQLNEISGRIITEGDRIAVIVSSLLSFARTDTDNRSITPLSDILNESIILAGTQLKKSGITLSISIDENIPPLLVQRQEIQQVFMNIINNSRYALNMRKADDGVKNLTISIGQFQKSGSPVVRTSFMDTGPGIKKNLIHKVINPFFSTKPKGEGTGLGLSISHRIISSHGGTLIIESIEGEYTKVIIDLPIHTV